MTFGEITSNGVLESKVSSNGNRILNVGKINSLSICVNKSGSKQRVVCVLNDICIFNVELNTNEQGKLPFSIAENTFYIFHGSGIFSTHDSVLAQNFGI